MIVGLLATVLELSLNFGQLRVLTRTLARDCRRGDLAHVVGIALFKLLKVLARLGDELDAVFF